MAKLAHDSEAHRFDAYGKCGVCAQTVRDPYLGLSPYTNSPEDCL